MNMMAKSLTTAASRSMPSFRGYGASDRLSKFDPGKLSSRQSLDLRILQVAVKKDIFQMQDMSVFERNPMVYARAADVNVYIKRNFAPLEDRVRSLVAIESQI